MENFIEVRNVTKAFDRHVALSDVSLTMRRGRVFGLLGPNGAGKTTTLKSIAGIISMALGTGTVQSCGNTPRRLR